MVATKHITTIFVIAIHAIVCKNVNKLYNVTNFLKSFVLVFKTDMNKYNLHIQQLQYAVIYY